MSDPARDKLAEAIDALCRDMRRLGIHSDRLQRTLARLGEAMSALGSVQVFPFHIADPDEPWSSGR